MVLKYIRLVCWWIGLFIVSLLISYVSQNEVTTWYPTLEKSSLTPPPYVFGPVWSVLYLLIGISGWLLWESVNVYNQDTLKVLFRCQLYLNWLWTPLFFGMQAPGLSLICILMLIVFVCLFIIKSVKTLWASAVLLMPYLAWILLAAYLNLYIWLYN